MLIWGPLVFGLTACESVPAYRGYRLDSANVDAVKVGISTREDVEKALGSPSFTGAFDPKVWYYIGRHTEQTSFFTPEVKDQTGLEVRFDESGTVAAVTPLAPSDRPTLEGVDRSTPTYGHDTTFWEQLLGSLRRPSLPGGGGASSHQ